jgi:Lon protease-like protein
MTERIDRVLPLFPLGQVVLFPGMALPLRIFEERYKVMIGACHVTDQLFGVVLIRHGSEVGAPADPERIGCTARMLRVDRFPDGRMNILSVGEQRFRLVGPARVMAEGYLVGDVQLLADDTQTHVPPELVASVSEQFAKYQRSMLATPGHAAPPEALPTDPLHLSYHVAAALHVHPRERQQLVELDDVAARLRQELMLLKRENLPSIGPFSMN